MTHASTQAQIFYILASINYSQTWEKVEYNLGYTLGDHRFISDDVYGIVSAAAKNLWAVLNNQLDGAGNYIE